MQYRNGESLSTICASPYE